MPIVYDQAPPDWMNYYHKTGKSFFSGANGNKTIDSAYPEYLEQCKKNKEAPLRWGQWLQARINKEI